MSSRVQKSSTSHHHVYKRAVHHAITSTKEQCITSLHVQKSSTFRHHAYKRAVRHVITLTKEQCITSSHVPDVRKSVISDTEKGVSGLSYEDPIFEKVMDRKWRRNSHKWNGRNYFSVQRLLLALNLAPFSPFSIRFLPLFSFLPFTSLFFTFSF